MAKSIFERIKDSVKEMKEESRFLSVRKPMLNQIGEKEEIQNCLVILHLRKDGYRIKVSYDLVYSANGEMYKQAVNLKYDLFEDCGLPHYIVESLSRPEKSFDIKFNFADLQQLYDELEIESTDSSDYEAISLIYKGSFDELVFTDRVFYTKVDYLKNGRIAYSILIGTINKLPIEIYNLIYPLKSYCVKK